MFVRLYGTINETYVAHYTSFIKRSLELLKCKNVNKWPDLRRDVIENVKMAIQINGKTRDIISVNKDLTQEEISAIINENKKIKKFMSHGKLFKTIFVKNRIVNYIIK